MNSIPDMIFNMGSVIDELHWKDRQGEHYFLITSTGIYETNVDIGADEPEPMLSSKFFVYHYLVSKNNYELIWEYNDKIEECLGDLTLTLAKGGLTITDLDNDGYGEITFIYKKGCRGDVSPVGLKLIMLANNNVFVLDGETKIVEKYDGETYTYGDGVYTADNKFKNFPKLLEYADKMWQKFVVEDISGDYE